MKILMLLAVMAFMMVSSAQAELVDGDFSAKGWAQTKGGSLWPHEHDGMLDAGWCAMGVDPGWTYNTSAKRAECNRDRYQAIGQIFTTKLEKGNIFKFDYEVKDSRGEGSTLTVVVVGSKGDGAFDAGDCLNLYKTDIPKDTNYKHTVLFNKSVANGSGKGTASVDLKEHDLKSYTYIQMIIMPQGFGEGGSVYISNARFAKESAETPPPKSK